MALEELETLSTKQLLARLRHLHQCEESSALSDRDIQGGEPSGTIEFKSSPEWVAEYNRLKALLDQREHIPKGVELVELRKKKARTGKSLDRKVGRHKQQ